MAAPTSAPRPCSAPRSAAPSPMSHPARAEGRGAARRAAWRPEWPPARTRVGGAAGRGSCGLRSSRGLARRRSCLRRARRSRAWRARPCDCCTGAAAARGRGGLPSRRCTDTPPASGCTRRDRGTRRRWGRPAALTASKQAPTWACRAQDLRSATARVLGGHPKARTPPAEQVCAQALETCRQRRQQVQAAERWPFWPAAVIPRQQCLRAAPGCAGSLCAAPVDAPCYPWDLGGRW